MLEASSPGRGLPKTKSINVEANILDGWLRERNRLVDRVTRRVLGIIIVLLIGCATLPKLWSMYSVAKGKDAVASKTLATIATRLNATQKASADAQPILDQDSMLQESRKKMELAVDHVLLILNAAPSNVAIASLKAEVMGGELTIQCKADAAGSDSGRAFVDEASKGPSTLSALQAFTRSSDVFGDKSIAFNFVKRVKVGN